MFLLELTTQSVGGCYTTFGRCSRQLLPGFGEGEFGLADVLTSKKTHYGHSAPIEDEGNVAFCLPNPAPLPHTQPKRMSVGAHKDGTSSSTIPKRPIGHTVASQSSLPVLYTVSTLIPDRCTGLTNKNRFEDSQRAGVSRERGAEGRSMALPGR